MLISRLARSRPPIRKLSAPPEENFKLRLKRRDCSVRVSTQVIAVRNPSRGGAVEMSRDYDRDATASARNRNEHYSELRHRAVAAVADLALPDTVYSEIIHGAELAWTAISRPV